MVNLNNITRTEHYSNNETKQKKQNIPKVTLKNHLNYKYILTQGNL